MIFNKTINYFFASTHGTPTLVDFYTYVELNKDTIIKCPFGKSMWQIHVAMMTCELWFIELVYDVW
jgi:hypothetical protein